MKRFSGNIFIFFIITLLFFGCEKGNELTPCFEGLYLKYYEVFGSPQKPEDIIWTRKIEYRFQQLENGNFHISQKVNTERGEKLGDKIDPTPYPEVSDDLTVNIKGIVVSGGINFNFPKGYPSYLWLPPDKRKEGAEVMEVMRKVENKTKWENWEVWTVEAAARRLKVRLKSAVLYIRKKGLMTAMTVR